MNNSVYGLIDRARENCLSGRVMERESIIRLLELPPESEEAEYLRRRANEAAMEITGGHAYLWGAMGIDFVPCPVSCDFCSFGEKWGIVKDSRVYSNEEIVRQMSDFVQAGAHYIVIRTTEFYSIDDLCAKVRMLKERISGNYEIILNIGEFDEKEALQMWQAGVSGVYHAVRLREGTDTGLDPVVRNDTMDAVRRSPLKLISLVEPVGPEHSSEEITDNFLNIIRHEASITGVMARFPVPGTPLGDRYARVSDERVAQIAAVLRLAAGTRVRDICVHPASELAISGGANVTVVELGAVPRDSKLIESEWRLFTADMGKTLFENAGYTLFS